VRQVLADLEENDEVVALANRKGTLNSVNSIHSSGIVSCLGFT